MLKKRSLLEDKLYNILSVIASRKQLVNKITEYMKEKHNMLAGETNYWILGMKPLKSASEEELYWITQALLVCLSSTEYAELVSDIDLSAYFSPKEKSYYQNSKIAVEKKSIYPIVFEKVIQVADDQWVGVVDVDTLFELYNHQILNYNRRTQRSATTKYVAGFATYDITLKKKSVKEISELLRSNLFVPNALSFNLSLDDDAVEFSFLDDKLILYRGQLDIIDGYHRFRGAIDTRMQYPDFNYQFIVNFMNFDEAKACLFISQEDKRNKLDSNFSKSIDSTQPANALIRRLNEDSTCYFHGKIGRLGGEAINSVYLFTLIKYLFPMKETKDIISPLKRIKNLLNLLVERDSISVDTELTYKQLAIILRCISLFENEMESVEHAQASLENIHNFNSVRFKNGQINKRMIDELDSFIRRR